MVEPQRRPALPGAELWPPTAGRDRPWVAVTSRVLLAAVVAIVAAIVFTPGPPDEPGQQDLARWLARVHETWMPGWVTFGLIEFAANVLMFVPLGMLAALAVRRHRWVAIPACLAFSAAIETAQHLALPLRDGTWQDLVANTAGASAGYLFAVLAARALWRRRGTSG